MNDSDYTDFDSFVAELCAQNEELEALIKEEAEKMKSLSAAALMYYFGEVLCQIKD